MGTGVYNRFRYTLGSTYYNNDSSHTETFSSRGIEIPARVKQWMALLTKPRQYIKGSSNDFSERDVSILSKETSVEYAKIIIGDISYLIRGDTKGAVIPRRLYKRLKKHSGIFAFHSHPHNNDNIPSVLDL